ncbi:hypothetical protein [Lentzea sp. NBRC 102530]|uniref:hypothetical protein n=1 Tax=Lentzea sp. NBRC 102530 TaxID=3032201 RepID=UPI002555FAAC|nr:hypothetical protein [Lentzea sp. NBRC 102530]
MTVEITLLDEVSARVWGADPPARSRATPHSCLSRPRHALGVTLTATPPGTCRPPKSPLWT